MYYFCSFYHVINSTAIVSYHRGHYYRYCTYFNNSSMLHHSPKNRFSCYYTFDLFFSLYDIFIFLIFIIICSNTEFWPIRLTLLLISYYTKSVILHSILEAVALFAQVQLYFILIPLKNNCKFYRIYAKSYFELLFLKIFCGWTYFVRMLGGATMTWNQSTFFSDINYNYIGIW